MGQLRVILFYWVYMIVVLIGTKLLGYSDDHKATIIIIVVATLVYAAAMFLYIKARGVVEDPQAYERMKKGKPNQKKIAGRKSSVQKNGKAAVPKNGTKAAKKNKKK